MKVILRSLIQVFMILKEVGTTMSLSDKEFNQIATSINAMGIEPVNGVIHVRREKVLDILRTYKRRTISNKKHKGGFTRDVEN